MKRPAIPVWDLPTRLFHWALLACVLVAWRTAETRDLGPHRIAGSIAAGLLVFRLWWGVVGASTARFSQFLKGPGAVFAYIRTLGSNKGAHAGHNPLGGLSVAALIVCLIVLIGAGLFAVDTDGLESGPFAAWISFDQGRLASHVHSMAFTVLEALVALHLTAILFYHLVKKHNLVGAMLTGRARAEGDPLRPGSPWLLAIGVALGAVTAATLAHLGGAF